MTEELTHSSISSTGQFGRTVAIHGNNLVVGAPRWDNGKGRIFVYSYDGTPELQVQEIRLDAGKGGDQFGVSIESAADFLAIGAPGHNEGTVTLFSEDHHGQWRETHTVTPADTTQDQRFGGRLAANDRRLWISAPRFNERRGGLYHFDLSSMQLSDVLNPDALQFRSVFGGSLAVDNGIVAVGAVGQHNYEGAIFPLRVTDRGVRVDEALFNTASEIASITGGMTECENGAAGIFPVRRSRYDFVFNPTGNWGAAWYSSE